MAQSGVRHRQAAIRCHEIKCKLIWGTGFKARCYTEAAGEAQFLDLGER